MKIIVSTCDKYDHLLPGFALQFNKYWPGQTVDIVGYRQPPPLPSNFNFTSLNPVDDRPFTYYLRPYIEACGAEYFVFLFDDYWLTTPVSTQHVALMESVVLAGADKGDLSTNTHHFPHGLYESMGPGNPRMYAADQTAPYRTSTQPCIWTRRYMLHLMNHTGMNPWEFELQGTANNDRGVIVGLDTQTYVYANVYYKGQPDGYQLTKLSVSDRECLKALGYACIDSSDLTYTRGI